ncbi:hypothetical protein E2C01_081992 [Portunus trituberculatus]|uniref:Uncharacterized protein n=1 Tax=Portunus trituberculatus TaxID=210409 RepID=A0A5B7IR75_PORTR|nr:hypothetical protein [Portunus trituberculatus]
MNVSIEAPANLPVCDLPTCCCCQYRIDPPRLTGRISLHCHSQPQGIDQSHRGVRKVLGLRTRRDERTLHMGELISMRT